MWLWTQAYHSLSLNFTLHNTMLYFACSELSHDIHLRCRFHLSLSDCHIWIVIFVLFQIVVSASSIFPGTLMMLSSKPNFTTLVQSVISNLGVYAMRQFEWHTKWCSGIFITAYCSVVCTYSCTGWVFIIADTATLQLWMAHPSVPHLRFIYVCCHHGLYSVMWRSLNEWLTW